MRAVNSKQAPPNISDLYCRTSSKHRYSTRSSTDQNFYTKHSKLTCKKMLSHVLAQEFGMRYPKEEKKLSKKSFNKR